jgi:threonine dehydratase
VTKSQSSDRIPDLKTIQRAAARIAPFAHNTPIITCGAIDDLIGARVFFKCENMQKVGAFKYRGATNAVWSLSEKEVVRGVATHSSGNHAQALSLAARDRGVPAYIVMPSTSPAVKCAAVEDYGGRITFCEPNLQARESTLETVVAKTGATFVHPYDNYDIIAGQATAAMEMYNELGKLDIMMAPVGGGGLLSGTALATSYLSMETRVIAGEPKGADDAFRSLEAGEIIPSIDPRTIADGLLTSLSQRTFAVISEHVEQILTVGEAGIVRAMRLLFERAKIVVEPSAAVPLGALLEGRLDVSGARIGIILSGGNIDLDCLPW